MIGLRQACSLLPHMPLHSPTLILASGSPRRRELLQSLGLRFVVRPVDLDETHRSDEAPEAYVRRLASAKARARGQAGELVLGADTIVVLDGEILGKPQNPADAQRMLRRLAGREHSVFTGVSLWEPERSQHASEVDRSRVRLSPLREEEIEWYVATGEPLDKAGGYAVQGVGALFVDSVEGNYSNVVGLPVPTTYRLFATLGYDLKQFRSEPTRPPGP